MLKILSVLFTLFPVLSNAHFGANIQHFAESHHIAVWGVVSVAVIAVVYIVKKIK